MADAASAGAAQTLVCHTSAVLISYNLRMIMFSHLLSSNVAEAARRVFIWYSHSSPYVDVVHVRMKLRIGNAKKSPFFCSTK